MTKQNIRDIKVERESYRAVEGEQVRVILNHVKPDRRQEFERFLHEYITPIVARTQPHVLDRSRFLFPTAPNDDGTYTYIFLIDPVVSDGVYELGEILRQDYPLEQIDEIIKLFSESLDSPQVGYLATQSSW